MVKAILLAVVAVAALAQLATAVDHPVGGSGVKWSTSGGYDAWSGAQKFTTKDSLGKQLLSCLLQLSSAVCPPVGCDYQEPAVV
jgi:hypothetical protein